MTRPTRLLLGGTAAIAIAVVVLAVALGAESDNGDDRGPMAAATFVEGLPGDAQGGLVDLVDQTLGLPIGTQRLPDGWTLRQDLATDPSTGEMARHRLDLRGPSGELIRSLGTQHYGPALGTDLGRAWQDAAARALEGEVDGLAFGPLGPSPAVEAQPGFRRVAPEAAQAGLRMEGLEAPFRGTRGGQPVEGVVTLTHLSAPQMPGMGTLTATALVAPAGGMAALREAERQIAEGFEPNPDHQARVQLIGQQVRQQSAAQHQATMDQIAANTQAMTQGHQQRMADSRASFDAHQQRMQGMWAQHDAHNAAWQTGQAAGDEAQRRRINAINETADVRDPSTGQVYRGVPSGAGSYWVDPVNNAVVGAGTYADNPDPTRYQRGQNLDNP